MTNDRIHFHSLAKNEITALVARAVQCRRMADLMESVTMPSLSLRAESALTEVPRYQRLILASTVIEKSNEQAVRPAVGGSERAPS